MASSQSVWTALDMLLGQLRSTYASSLDTRVITATAKLVICLVIKGVPLNRIDPDGEIMTTCINQVEASSSQPAITCVITGDSVCRRTAPCPTVLGCQRHSQPVSPANISICCSWRRNNPSSAPHTIHP